MNYHLVAGRLFCLQLETSLDLWRLKQCTGTPLPALISTCSGGVDLWSKPKQGKCKKSMLKFHPNFIPSDGPVDLSV